MSVYIFTFTQMQGIGFTCGAQKSIFFFACGRFLPLVSVFCNVVRSFVNELPISMCEFVSSFKLSFISPFKCTLTQLQSSAGTTTFNKCVEGLSGSSKAQCCTNSLSNKRWWMLPGLCSCMMEGEFQPCWHEFSQTRLFTPLPNTQRQRAFLCIDLYREILTARKTP